MFQQDLAPHEHQDQAAGQLRPGLAPGAHNVPRLSSSWLRDSRIMFRPMRPSSRKAIQWSMLAIRTWKRLPSSQPKKGIRP